MLSLVCACLGCGYKHLKIFCGGGSFLSKVPLKLGVKSYPRRFLWWYGQSLGYWTSSLYIYIRDVYASKELTAPVGWCPHTSNNSWYDQFAVPKMGIQILCHDAMKQPTQSNTKWPRLTASRASAWEAMPGSIANKSQNSSTIEQGFFLRCGLFCF